MHSPGRKQPEHRSECQLNTRVGRRARFRVVDQRCRTVEAHGSDEDEAYTEDDESNAIVTSKRLCQWSIHMRFAASTETLLARTIMNRLNFSTTGVSPRQWTRPRTCLLPAEHVPITFGDPLGVADLPSY
jgi:hypothetical protein